MTDATNILVKVYVVINLRTARLKLAIFCVSGQIFEFNGEYFECLGEL